jgi:hypothetical protein
MLIDHTHASVIGSERRIVKRVELRGLEPLTFALPARRSSS